MGQYADLAQTLKDTPMGAGTCSITPSSTASATLPSRSTTSMKNYHIVLMGHAGGKIRATATTARRGARSTELMLTLQQVMGMNVTSFGTWDKTSTTMETILEPDVCPGIRRRLAAAAH